MKAGSPGGQVPDDRTLALLGRLVESRPDDWDARAHLAGLLVDAGRAADAVRLLESAPSVPSTPEAGLLLGRALAASDPARALRHYQALVAKDRRLAAAHLALARLFRERGLKEDARHHYGIAVVLDAAMEDPGFDDWIHGGGDAPAPGTAAAAHGSAPEEARGAGEGPAAPPGPAREDEAPSAEDLQALLDVSGTAVPRLPKLTFDDVGGMEDVKEQIRMRVVYPFRSPEIFRRFRKRSGGGILLYGPPGCGKTYLARATAGECGARFVAVGISDILSRWLGESERRLSDLFGQARRLAPTVVFLDELDALGMDRREARGSALQTTINQLLTELDGVGASNESVLVLAATNAPWNVDPAFRRPGRFDRVVFVPPPDAEARALILRLHLKGVPHDEPDYGRLARATRRFSGADLRAVVEQAAEAAIRDEMRTGRPGRITEKALLKAVGATKPSTLEWMESARRYASYANTGGQYDDVAAWFQREQE